MIEESTIRRQLDEFRQRLTELDEERDAVQGIVTGYETLLRKMARPSKPKPVAESKPAGPSKTSTHKDAPKKNTGIVGTMSMRAAVAEVMRAATEPLHTQEVLARARAKGADTTSKDPGSVVDLVLLDLSTKGRVRKVRPRTYQWIGGES